MVASYGGPVPWILIEGLLCREFGWTLSELREQPAHDVMLMWLALNKYDEVTANRKPS